MTLDRTPEFGEVIRFHGKGGAGSAPVMFIGPSDKEDRWFGILLSGVSDAIVNICNDYWAPTAHPDWEWEPDE